MTTDLHVLALTCVWALVLIFIPAFGRLRLHGLPWGAGNRDVTPPEPAWLGRADRAHRNLMETFLPFAALVIVAHLAQRHDGLTAQAGVAYLAARVAHGVVYIAGIPWLRTAMFGVSLAAVATLAWRVLAP